MKTKHLFSLAALAAALALSGQVNADTTTANASAKWQAKAIKKSDVDLNVFAEGSTNLDFQWNPTSGAFTTQDRALTVQAAGFSDTTAYSITAQLFQNTLFSTSTRALMNVGARLGGISILTTPTVILAGTDAAPTTSAVGMSGLNLATLGSLTTPNGSYHEATSVPIQFSIIGGKTATGTDVAADKLASLDDGSYAGDVELRFMASWERPAAVTP